MRGVGLCVVLLVGVRAACAGDDVCLVRDGRALCTIVLPDGASGTVQFAGAELARYIKQISGAEVLVIQEGKTPAGVRIDVGPTQAGRAAVSEGRVAAEFRRKYDAWLDSLTRPREGEWWSSEFPKGRYFDDNPAFQELVAMGPPALPYMMEEIPNNRLLGHGVCLITGFSFDWVRSGDGPSTWQWHWDEFPEMGRKKDPPSNLDEVWQRWWQDRENLTKRWFEERYAAWKTLKAEGKEKEAAAKLKRIEELGIDALPLLVERVEKGDSELGGVIAELSNRPWAPAEMRLPKGATSAQCATWWAENKAKWTLPPAAKTENGNSAPE